MISGRLNHLRVGVGSGAGSVDRVEYRDSVRVLRRRVLVARLA
ncbi:hypothetical protein ACFQ6H_15865 [Rhodococcus sp. NPDC056506]